MGDQQEGEGSPERRETENAFLKKFDIRFVLRRLNFLSRRVTQLALLDDDALLLLKAWLDHDPEAPELDLANRPKGWDDNFRDELSLIRKSILAPKVTNARSAQEKLLNPQSDTGKPAALPGDVEARYLLVATAIHFAVRWPGRPPEKSRRPIERIRVPTRKSLTRIVRGDSQRIYRARP